MRTLVLGVPLPHVSFDNYSFLSAPSFADYLRLVVDMESVSRVVGEVTEGAAEHRTFGGQPIANAATSPRAFGLADLLAMRRREAEWLLGRGGAIVCLAHPDVTHPDVAGIGEWRRYAWLPEPEGFSYQDHLLPAFGRPGMLSADPGHPFAPYAEALAAHLAYRVHLAAEAPAWKSGEGAVFLRSPGGQPVGAELRVLRGAVIILPPLHRPEADRTRAAETLFQCLEGWQNRTAEAAAGKPKEKP